MARVRGRRAERGLPLVRPPPRGPRSPGRPDRLSRLRATLLRAGYRVAYRVLSLYWAVFRPTKRGVVCVLTRNDDVLLVRHTYGRRWEWDLPGGGMRRGEEPSHAAAREIEEELGIAPIELVFIGELFERIGGKHDELWCFSAEVGDPELSPSPVEIAEARWFAAEALPPARTRYVDRLVALTRTARPRPR